MCKVGQNCVYTLYMTVYLASTLPKLPHMHRIYMWLRPILSMCYELMQFFVQGCHECNATIIDKIAMLNGTQTHAYTQTHACMQTHAQREFVRNHMYNVPMYLISKYYAAYWHKAAKLHQKLLTCACSLCAIAVVTCTRWICRTWPLPRFV